MIGPRSLVFAAILRSMLQSRRRLKGLALVVSVVISLTGCEPPPQLRIGDVPPSVTLLDLSGRQVTFPDDFKGQILMIRFWADWCPYCKGEMAAIEPIYREYRAKGFNVLAINVKQSTDVARKFVDALRLSYPVLLDDEGSTARRYGVVGLPTTVILDRDGVVREKILGEAQGDLFRELVHGYMG